MDGCSRRRLLQGQRRHQEGQEKASGRATSEGGEKTLQKGHHLTAGLSLHPFVLITYFWTFVFEKIPSLKESYILTVKMALLLSLPNIRSTRPTRYFSQQKAYSKAHPSPNRFRLTCLVTKREIPAHVCFQTGWKLVSSHLCVHLLLLALRVLRVSIGYWMQYYATMRMYTVEFMHTRAHYKRLWLIFCTNLRDLKPRKVL